MIQTKEERLVPALRFPEFEGKWSGKTLGSLASFSKGKGISKSDIVDGGALKCIRYGELYTEYSEVINEVKSSTNHNAEEVVLSEENDVIIPASGETQIDIATASCVLKSGIALGGDLNIIKSPVSGIFLSYYLNNARKNDIARLAQGISVVHLYASQLKSLVINLPSSEEQQKIASFLTAVDQRIQLLRRKKAQLEQYKRGVMQQLFSQELRFKDENGHDFPDWEEKKFGNTARRVKKRYDPKTDERNFRCIELESLSQNTGELLHTFDSKEQKSMKNKFEGGHILFGKLRPYLKKYYKATFEGVCSSEIWVLTGNKIDSSFLFYLIQTEKFNYEINLTTGSKMPRAEWNHISEVSFSFPKTQEQQKIASFLSSIDTNIEKVGQQIGVSMTFKKGLLQKMFV